MKNLFLFFIATTFGGHLSCFSQQWITQKYDYEVTEDVFFGTAIDFNGNTDSLKMDIYSPICDDVTHTSRRPLLICIYGGGFIEGTRKDPSVVDNCINFAKRGYVTAAIDYRLGYVFDENPWDCSIENYSCFFATDTAEWARAYYRGVQDGKGALRYLINRNEEWRIDADNVFVMGESAGAMVALGMGLLDTIAERPPATYAIPDAPAPNPLMYDCLPQTYSGESIERPDLGPIEGSIEPTELDYTIKGIGNIFGAMFSDLLKNTTSEVKPVIYSFHQPCDLLVPIDSTEIYWGLSWCMTHGYNCYGFANTPKVYGSRTMDIWNESNNYGYAIQSDFTSMNFPYDFWIGQASCIDQGVNSGSQCHGYDNKSLRMNMMADHFVTAITTSPICDTAMVLSVEKPDFIHFNIYPNPTKDRITLEGQYSGQLYFTLFNSVGKTLSRKSISFSDREEIDLSNLPVGIYLLRLGNDKGFAKSVKVVKE